MAEVEQLREEHLRPIGEDEPVEFDGLRRRRTILRPDSVGTGSISRRKTIHPPLGMSRLPDPEEEDTDDFHPGIFHFRRKHHSEARTSADHAASVPLSPMKPDSAGRLERVGSQDAGEGPHIYGLPPALQRESDTSYKGSQHIQFAGDTGDVRPTTASTLSPPPPVPPHRDSASRSFSFQNVFHRNRGSSQGESSDRRPISRGALSFSSRKSSSNYVRKTDGTTEEERLGLVKGDSSNNVALPNYSGSPPEYNDTLDPDYDWSADVTGNGRSQRLPEPRNLTSQQQQPPGYTAASRRGSDDSEDEPPQSKEVESSGHGRRPSGPPGRGPGGAGYI
jgi:magnesium transporter